MNWMDQIGGLLQQYANKNDDDPYDNADNDFDQVAQQAPPQAVSQGLSEAFRSNATPPFPNMLGQLFGQSDPNQRANILNMLLRTAGPALLGGALSRGGGAGAMGGIGGLLGQLGGALSSGQQQVTPEVAAQIPPQAVEQLAEKAQQQDPTVVDRISDFYAQNPTVVKALGAVALGIAMRHLAKQKGGGLF
jgi:hypothetical protein